jgi:hypothetical protein
MSKREDELGLEDTSFFTDADWAALNKLLDILRDNGSDAAKSAWQRWQEMTRFRLSALHALSPRHG